MRPTKRRLRLGTLALGACLALLTGCGSREFIGADVCRDDDGNLLPGTVDDKHIDENGYWEITVDCGDAPGMRYRVRWYADDGNAIDENPPSEYRVLEVGDSYP